MATLTEINTLINEPAITEKVKSAVIIAAKDVAFEDEGTANHTNRLKWAKSALSDPNGMATRVTRYVIAANNTLTLAEITALSDTDIKNNCNACINIFADGS